MGLPSAYKTAIASGAIVLCSITGCSRDGRIPQDENRHYL